MQLNYSEFQRQAQEAIQKLVPSKRQYIKPSQSIAPLKSIGQLNFQKKNIDQFISKLPYNGAQIKQFQNELPPSVRLLNYYAQKAGFKPMGQITDKVGNKYIGRRQNIDQFGRVFVRQFPAIYSRQTDSPDLFSNFTTYANNAIGKWNQFVQAEAKLGHYIQNASDEKKRQILMSRYAKLSSLGTRFLKTLSSLYVLYFSDRSVDRDFLKLGNQETINAIKVILKQRGTVQDIITNVLQFTARNAEQSKHNFLISFINERRKTLQVQLKPQQYERIRHQVQSRTVYIPPQMVAKPNNQTPQWIKYFERQRNASNQLLILEVWDSENTEINFLNFF